MPIAMNAPINFAIGLFRTALARLPQDGSWIGEASTLPTGAWNVMSRWSDMVERRRVGGTVFRPISEYRITDAGRAFLGKPGK